MSFCPACGAATRTAQGLAPHLQCISCGAMHWQNPAAAVGVALLRGTVGGREVLLSRRAGEPKRGEWDLVGGFLEPGEDADAGMEREVREETTCGVRALHLVEATHGSYAGRPTINLLYTGVVDGEPVAQDDSLEVRWFPLSGLPALAWPHEEAFLRRLAAIDSQDARRLGAIPWTCAEPPLGQAIVVWPLGAAAKQHGPHLPLATDQILADCIAHRVASDAAKQEAPGILLAPTITLHHYPAFAAYPGSVGLARETARDAVVEAVLSLARHGARRHYVLNTGISTVEALRPAAEVLRAQGVLLEWTDWDAAMQSEAHLLQQPAGTHADEAETSLMLQLAPYLVDMAKAVREIPDPAPGPWRRDNSTMGGMVSPSGVYGDATLATPGKGQALAEAVVRHVLADLQRLAAAPLPPRQGTAPRS